MKKILLRWYVLLLLALVPIAALAAVPSYTGFTSRPTGYVVSAADWNNEFGNFINHVNTYVIGNLNLLNAKGNLLSHNGVSIEALTNAGATDNGKLLTFDSTVATGMKWASIASVSTLTTKGDLLGFAAANARVPVGADGTVLTADSTNANGVAWSAGSFPVGGIILWSGSLASIPSGWHLCDGASGTPNLQGLFILGAGNVSPAATGGAGLVAVGGPSGDTSAGAGLGPSHTHTLSFSTGTVAAGGSFNACTGGGAVSTTITPRYYALAYIQKI